MAKSFQEVVQYLQDWIVDDKELSDHLDAHMEKSFHGLKDEAQDNEQAELLHYALRNERMLLILATVMSNLGPKD